MDNVIWLDYLPASCREQIADNVAKSVRTPGRKFPLHVLNLAKVNSVQEDAVKNILPRSIDCMDLEKFKDFEVDDILRITVDRVRSVDTVCRMGFRDVFFPLLDAPLLQKLQLTDNPAYLSYFRNCICLKELCLSFTQTPTWNEAIETVFRFSANPLRALRISKHNREDSEKLRDDSSRQEIIKKISARFQGLQSLRIFARLEGEESSPAISEIPVSPYLLPNIESINIVGDFQVKSMEKLEDMERVRITEKTNNPYETCLSLKTAVTHFHHNGCLTYEQILNLSTCSRLVELQLFVLPDETYPLTALVGRLENLKKLHIKGTGIRREENTVEDEPYEQLCQEIMTAISVGRGLTSVHLEKIHFKGDEVEEILKMLGSRLLKFGVTIVDENPLEELKIVLANVLAHNPEIQGLQLYKWPVDWLGLTACNCTMTAALKVLAREVAYLIAKVGSSPNFTPNNTMRLIRDELEKDSPFPNSQALVLRPIGPM